MLSAKGWTMINAFDPSAAFASDTAAQSDGLHIMGPPMRTMVVKLFHHRCANHDGTPPPDRLYRSLVPTTDPRSLSLICGKPIKDGLPSYAAASDQLHRRDWLEQ